MHDVTLLSGSQLTHAGGTIVDELFRITGNGTVGTGTVTLKSVDEKNVDGEIVGKRHGKLIFEGVTATFINDIVVEGQIGFISVGPTDKIGTVTDVATVSGSITGDAFQKEASGTLIVTSGVFSPSAVSVAKGQLELQGHARSIDDLTMAPGATLKVTDGTLTLQQLDSYGGAIEAAVVMAAGGWIGMEFSGDLTVTDLQLNGAKFDYFLDANNSTRVLKVTDAFNEGSVVNTIQLNGFEEGTYTLIDAPAGTLHAEKYEIVRMGLLAGQRGELKVESENGRERLVLEIFTAVDANTDSGEWITVFGSSGDKTNPNTGR